MTILPKKNKNREQCDQESAAHGHSHGAARETHMSAAGMPGPSMHHIPVHGRPGTQAAAAADARKPPGYPSTSWSLPAAALDDKIAAKEGSSSDLESGPSQSKRRLRSPPATAAAAAAAALRSTSKKQSRAPAGKPSAATPSSDSEDSATGYNSEDEYGQPAYQDNIEELEIRFEKTMKEKMGLCIKLMEPDGACLFRAVADQVYGDQDMHGVVRQHCIDYMRKNSDHFSAYVTEDFASYLDRKQTDSCHGNHVEMQAMSELYNRPVEVYQYSTKPINIYHGDYKLDLHYPIRISYHRNVHYNSLVDPYKATVGIGLGLPEYQPGLADKNLMTDATRQSENVHIEETMLQDKIRETDWELTDEALQEQVARESYLQWLHDNEKRARSSASSSSSSSSSSSRAESASKAASASSAAAAAAAATATTSSALSPSEECCSSINWLEDLAGRRSPPSPPALQQQQQLAMPPLGGCCLPSRQTAVPLLEQPPRAALASKARACARSSAADSPRVGNCSSDGSSNGSCLAAGTSCTTPPAVRAVGGDANSSKGSVSPAPTALGHGGVSPTSFTLLPSTSAFSETASVSSHISPEVLGLTDDWAEDALLAQVLAQSAQEYVDSLKRSAPPGASGSAGGC